MTGSTAIGASIHVPSGSMPQGVKEASSSRPPSWRQRCCSCDGHELCAPRGHRRTVPQLGRSGAPCLGTRRSNHGRIPGKRPRCLPTWCPVDVDEQAVTEACSLGPRIFDLVWMAWLHGCIDSQRPILLVRGHGASNGQRARLAEASRLQAVLARSYAGTQIGVLQCDLPPCSHSGALRNPRAHNGGCRAAAAADHSGKHERLA